MRLNMQSSLTDNGDRMFNFSEWPHNRRGQPGQLIYPGTDEFWPAAEGVGISVRPIWVRHAARFWPEISHKFKLPFPLNLPAKIST